LWVGVGCFTGNTMTSPDGVTWTSHIGAMPSSICGSLANNYLSGASNLWVLSDSGGNYTSTDGITWTARTSCGKGLVAYGNGMWAAGGNTLCQQSSPDGITWTNRTQAGGDPPGSLGHNGLSGAASLFVETGALPWATSQDGITWTAITGGFAG